MTTLPRAATVSETPTELEHHVSLADIEKAISHSLTLRRWQRDLLPIEANDLGFEVFMRLAQWCAARQRGQQMLLKQLYLELPYSERGVRMHLRRLEAGGWIKIQRTHAGDTRSAEVELTNSAWTVLEDYVRSCRQSHSDSADSDGMAQDELQRGPSLRP
jgi:hypothetical protein